MAVVKNLANHIFASLEVDFVAGEKYGNVVKFRIC